MEKSCSGCGVCIIACPKRCISLKLNDKGFYKAEVDQLNCIQCRICQKVCPMDITQCNNLDNSKLYSAYSKNDEIRKKSSSGGMAYLLAQLGLNKGYKVCGAAYNYSLNEVEHIVIKDFRDLYLIQGSKYLQSKTNVFKQIVEESRIDKTSKFMVFGTPCQISGLRKLIKLYKIESQFLLIDIYCHGIPSYLLWKQYLLWIEKRGIEGKKIKAICFRDKKYSWHEYFMHITTDEKEYVCNRNKDPFLKLFSMGVLNQKECFTCQYRNKSQADIRLGDYWGERYRKSEEGYSMVLINNSKGDKVFKELLNDENIFCEKMPIIDRFGQQYKDYPVPLYYDQTFKMLRKEDTMQDIINLYDPPINRLKRNVKKIIKSIFVKR